MMDKHWVDWESHAFGFGYGSGEKPIIIALKCFLELCKEGSLIRSYDYRTLEKALGEPVTWLLINRLCHHEIQILEYGSSPRYAWLTEQGVALRDYMLSKSTNELIDLCCCRNDRLSYTPCGYDYCNCSNDECKTSPFWGDGRIVSK